MSKDLIKRLRDALQEKSRLCGKRGEAEKRDELAELIAEADAALSSVDQSRELFRDFMADRNYIYDSEWDSDSDIDKLRTILFAVPDTPEMALENKLFRKMLFFRCCGMSGYHDDGELQDASEYPTIDFKRESAQAIELKLIARALTIFSKAEVKNADT